MWQMSILQIKYCRQYYRKDMHILVLLHYNVSNWMKSTPLNTSVKQGLIFGVDFFTPFRNMLSTKSHWKNMLKVLPSFTANSKYMLIKLKKVKKLDNDFILTVVQTNVKNFLISRYTKRANTILIKS